MKDEASRRPPDAGNASPVSCSPEYHLTEWLHLSVCLQAQSERVLSIAVRFSWTLEVLQTPAEGTRTRAEKGMFISQEMMSSGVEGSGPKLTNQMKPLI